MARKQTVSEVTKVFAVTVAEASNNLAAATAKLDEARTLLAASETQYAACCNSFDSAVAEHRKSCSR